MREFMKRREFLKLTSAAAIVTGAGTTLILPAGFNPARAAAKWTVGFSQATTLEPWRAGFSTTGGFQARGQLAAGESIRANLGGGTPPATKRSLLRNLSNAIRLASESQPV